MDRTEIYAKTDHTLLNQTATWQEIQQICEDALKYGTASVCIPPSYVKQAREYLGDRMEVCTVIGFPNGYNTTAVKEFEIRDAVANGAGELDMVINLGWVKDGRFDLVEEEIRILKKACQGKILKVIVETCLLTDDEKVKACRICEECGADFVKTSTGFSKGGATIEDVALMRRTVGSGMGVKASGGIRSLEDAQAMVKAGAVRLGTSSGVAIMQAND